MFNIIIEDLFSKYFEIVDVNSEELNEIIVLQWKFEWNWDTILNVMGQYIQIFSLWYS